MFYHCALVTCSLMAFSECAPRGLSRILFAVCHVFFAWWAAFCLAWRAYGRVYMTVDGFVAIDCIDGIGCISFVGATRWLRTKLIELLLRARPMF